MSTRGRRNSARRGAWRCRWKRAEKECVRAGKRSQIRARSPQARCVTATQVCCVRRSKTSTSVAACNVMRCTGEKTSVVPRPGGKRPRGKTVNAPRSRHGNHATSASRDAKARVCKRCRGKTQTKIGVVSRSPKRVGVQKQQDGNDARKITVARGAMPAREVQCGNGVRRGNGSRARKERGARDSLANAPRRLLTRRPKEVSTVLPQGNAASGMRTRQDVACKRRVFQVRAPTASEGSKTMRRRRRQRQRHRWWQFVSNAKRPVVARAAWRETRQRMICP